MNSAVALCRCCGQPLPPDLPARWDAAGATFTSASGSVRFRPQEARFFDVLYRNRNREGVRDPRDLFAAAYADDPNGGPNCMSAVAVMMRQIRTAVEPVGFTVTRNMGVPRRGYRLVVLDRIR